MTKNLDSISRTPYLSESNGSLTRVAKLLLDNPFPLDAISWKPTDVRGNECVALCYADKRVYEDRLDQVFGPHNWKVDINAFTGPYRKVKKAKYKKFGDPTSEVLSPAEVTEGDKIFAVVTISVTGLGYRTSTSDSETDDDNSIMTAEAQAFKRACSMYGIGKYLYSLPRGKKCAYSFGKIVDPPELPPSAYPYSICEECEQKVEDYTVEDSNGRSKTFRAEDIVKRAQDTYGQELCMGCITARKSSEKKVTKVTKDKEAAKDLEAVTIETTN
jgi:hypothetical protein